MDEDSGGRSTANTVVSGWQPLDTLEIGDEIVAPAGVKIAYDGRSEYDDRDEEDQDYSFAVYIREASLTEPFPEHDSAYGMVLHRPDEVCVWAWIAPDGTLSSVNVYDAIANDSDKPEGTYEKYQAIAQSIWSRDSKKR